MESNFPHIRPYPQRLTYLQGWHLYRWAFVQHHIQGAVAGLFVFFAQDIRGVAFALGWLALYTAYQWLSYYRKKDSPGLDVADFMVGWVLAYHLAKIGEALWT